MPGHDTEPGLSGSPRFLAQMPQTSTGRRKLAAILSADVVGYSRLMRDDEHATVATLLERRSLMGSMIAAARGRVVDSPGDALLAEFASAVEAVECALAIQARLGELDDSVPDSRRMRLRIGINLGDVIEQDGALYGDGVNIAARLEALAAPGGVCVSSSIFEHVDGKVDAHFEDAGHQVVKNIDRPVRAYHVRPAGLEEPSPRPASTPATPPAVAQLAKLSRPRVHGAIERGRLFRLLDDFRGRSCIWISGPPGSGKTTLVATWLDLQDGQALWYHVDAGDRDPATFFTYLALLAAPYLSAGARTLPYLGPEYLGDLTGFARRFFRQLFEILPVRSRLVIDNHHDASGQPLDDLLKQAIDEMPSTHQLVVISRSAVPSALARPVANGVLGKLSWDELKLTEAETATLVAERSPAHLKEAGRLHNASGGWAAGIVLMSSSDVIPETTGSIEPADTVFAYFAEEILGGLPPDDRDLLLRSSCLPQFTLSMVEGLCDHPSPQEFLDRLVRRQYFTERRGGTEPRYRYHDLFRSFLQARARATLAPDQWRATLERGAEVLEEGGELDAAMNLLRETGQHDRFSLRVIAHSGEYLARGRWRTVLDWLSGLPDEVVKGNAELLYWKGVAREGQDPVAGRVILEQAYGEFQRGGNHEGQARSCAEIVNSFFHEWNMVSTLDLWIDALQNLLRVPEELPERVVDACLTSVLQALLNRRPTHPTLPATADEVERRLIASDDADARLKKAWNLMYYFDQTGSFDRSDRVFRSIEDALERADGLPMNLHLCWNRRAYHCYFCGKFTEGLESASKALEIAELHGLRDHAFTTVLVGAITAISSGDLAIADRWREMLRQRLSISQHMHTLGFQWVELWSALERNDLAKAEAVWETFSKLTPAGVPIYTAYNHAVVWLLILQGNAEAALARVHAWRQPLLELDSDWIRFNFQIMEASTLLHLHRRDEANTTLASAMALARRRGYRNVLTWVTPMMSDLLAHALEDGIDPETASNLIRTRRVPRPPTAVGVWPTPVEIRCLGRFEIKVNGETVLFSRKTPRKTLALLKAIATRGNRGLAPSDAAAELWPDLDGDAAADALAASLYRVRKILGGPSAIALTNGTLRLDPAEVWVDAAAFDDLASHASATTRARAIPLYAGPLLPNDIDEPWSLAARDRLRARYTEVVLEAGDRAEHAGDFNEARRLYRAAISAEPATEPLYLALMRCNIASGRQADAISVFEELMRALAAALGVGPSPAAEALARTASTAP